MIALAVMLAATPASLDAGAPPDGAARLSSAPYASEIWNVTATFEDGYRLFTWFFVTNEGPGEQNAGALWYLVRPDGRVAEYRNGRQRGRWRLSPDRRRLDIASSSLDLGGPTGRMAIDSTSQRVKIDLQFPQRLVAGTAGAAERRMGATALQIATPIAGTIWERGMPAPLAVQGTAAITYTWMEETVPRVLQRRIELFADQPGLAIYLSDIVAPGAAAPQRWMTIERQGVPVFQSADVTLALAPPGPGPGSRRYPLPTRLLAQGERMRLDVRPERLLLRANPIDRLPQPFRFLYARSVAPQWNWLEAVFHLELGEETLEGRGILAVNFVNPMGG